jgi:hypothetical protein
MKLINTTAKTGDKFTVPNTNLKGEIGTYKDGKIRLLFYVNNFSGFSDYVSTKELNRRIKNNIITINN